MRSRDALRSARIFLEPLIAARGPILRDGTEPTLFFVAVETQPAVRVCPAQRRTPRICKAATLFTPVGERNGGDLQPTIDLAASAFAEPRDDVPDLPVGSR